MSYCKKFGHYAYECRKKQYDQGRKIPNKLTSTNTPTSAMSMASTSLIEWDDIQEPPHDIWCLDSGCNNHMTSNLNLFSSLDNSVQTDVTLGNNVQVTVSILTKQGEHKYMHDVYHLEGLKHNLLSIGQLIHKGYIVYMGDNHCVIKYVHPRKQLIARVPMTSNLLFQLRIIPNNTKAAFKVESKEEVVHCNKKENDSTNF